MVRWPGPIGPTPVGDHPFPVALYKNLILLTFCAAAALLIRGLSGSPRAPSTSTGLARALSASEVPSQAIQESPGSSTAQTRSVAFAFAASSYVLLTSSRLLGFVTRCNMKSLNIDSLLNGPMRPWACPSKRPEDGQPVRRIRGGSGVGQDSDRAPRRAPRVVIFELMLLRRLAGISLLSLIAWNAAGNLSELSSRGAHEPTGLPALRAESRAHLEGARRLATELGALRISASATVHAADPIREPGLGYRLQGAGLLHLAGVEKPGVIKLFQFALWVGCLALLGNLLYLHTGSKHWGLAGAALLSCSLLFRAYCAVIDDEIAITFLFLLASRSVVSRNVRLVPWAGLLILVLVAFRFHLSALALFWIFAIRELGKVRMVWLAATALAGFGAWTLLVPGGAQLPSFAHLSFFSTVEALLGISGDPAYVENLWVEFLAANAGRATPGFLRACVVWSGLALAALGWISLHFRGEGWKNDHHAGTVPGVLLAWVPVLLLGLMNLQPGTRVLVPALPVLAFLQVLALRRAALVVRRKGWLTA